MGWLPRVALARALTAPRSPRTARRATIGEVLRDRVLGGCNCDSIPEKTFKKIKQSAAQTCWAASTAMVRAPRAWVRGAALADGDWLA
jgi:hypothetical protein